MKQVIVMRTDLNMRKGKMIAQGAHASLMGFITSHPTQVNPWMAQHGMRKICVRVDSEEELTRVLEHARSVGVNAAKVIDRGDTEFGGIPTFTCIAIGPEVDARIDPITGGLKLL